MNVWVIHSGNVRGEHMRSRTVREGSVGLLILLGLGLTVGLGLWVRGVNLSQRGYRVIAQFPNVTGMREGAVVRFRGVDVGRIEKILPKVSGVEVTIRIFSEDLQIPRQVLVEAKQEGLIGEITLDINPQPDAKVANLGRLNPRDNRCTETSPIVCDGDRLKGDPSPDINDLIRSSIELSESIGDPKLLGDLKDVAANIARLSKQLSDPSLFEDIKSVADNTASATDGIADLSREIITLASTLDEELTDISDAVVETTDSAGRAADRIAELGDRLNTTTTEVNTLIARNRQNLTQTLDNINATSLELRESIAALTPVVEKVGQNKFLDDLAILSNNAAEASVKLRDLSTTLGSEENLLLLQETLDSARATFQNVQKLTADLDEVTGDPTFRENLRQLVKGLNSLISSTEDLQQQTLIAEHFSAQEHQAEVTPPSESEPEQVGQQPKKKLDTPSEGP